MYRKIRLLFLVLLLGLGSCSKTLFFTGEEIFQTLAPGEGLVFYGEGLVSSGGYGLKTVVKVESNTDEYYDGKSLWGPYKMIGTYQYITAKDFVKTVPVYVKKSEYKKLYTK
jgi:hypothetical protein